MNQITTVQVSLNGNNLHQFHDTTSNHTYYNQPQIQQQQPQPTTKFTNIINNTNSSQRIKINNHYLNSFDNENANEFYNRSSTNSNLTNSTSSSSSSTLIKNTSNSANLTTFKTLANSSTNSPVIVAKNTPNANRHLNINSSELHVSHLSSVGSISTNDEDDQLNNEIIDNKIDLDDDNLDDENDEFNSLHNMNIIMDNDYDLETSSSNHLDDTSSQQNLKSICIITGNSSFKPNINKTRSNNNSNNNNNYVNAINNNSKNQTQTALRGNKELDNSAKDLLDLSQQTLSSNNANNSINTIDTIDEDLNANPSSSLIIANTPSTNGNSCFHHHHHSVSATTASVSANLLNKNKQPAMSNRNIESCSSSISSKSSILSNSAIINSTSNQANSSMNQLGARDNIPGINLPMSNASNSGSINDDGSATSEVIYFI